jgi:hypothetical protein
MLNFRDGVMDFGLLKMLREKDPARAEEIIQTLVRSHTDYETKDTAAFHQARKMVLEALQSRK